MKIILLGDEKVGKTSLYNKYVNGKFPEQYSLSKSTQFKKLNLNINGEVYNLQLWDTPGNEQKHKIYMSIYLNSNGVIILFDITNKNSFDNVFNKWIPNFFNFFQTKQIELKDFPIIILGNFNDLSDKRTISKQEVQGKLKEIAKYTNFSFYQEISIKKDSMENFIKKVILFINSQQLLLGTASQTPPQNQGQGKKNDGDSGEINALREKIKILENEKLNLEKREKEEKEKNTIMINSLNDKVSMLEQVKMILTEKDKKDKEEKNKLNNTIKTLLEEKQKLTEENAKNQQKNKLEDEQ